MSEAKFSKGDWFLNDSFDENYWYIDVLNNKGVRHSAIAEICVKMAEGSGDCEEYDEELKANAFLMFKSNKMYEMLSDLANDYSCQCGHPRCSKEKQKTEILDLLAEARGGIK